MKYDIITVPNRSGLIGLTLAVQKQCNEGWEPNGGPFFDHGIGAWCQSVVLRVAQPKPGEIKLKEPRR